MSRNGSVVVVSLSGHRARVLEAVRRDRDLVVQRWGDEAAEGDEAGAASALAKLLADRGIRERKVIVLLPAQGVVVKRVQLPPATPAQLPQLVAFEAQRYLPLPVDQLATGYVAAPQSPGEASNQVLLAVSRRSELSRVASALQSVGLSVGGFAVEPLAITDAYLRSAGPTANGHSRLVLAAGEVGVHAQVLYGPRLLFCRYLPTQTGWQADLTRSLSTYSLEPGSIPVGETLLLGELDADGLGALAGGPVRRATSPLTDSTGRELTAEWSGLVGAARQALGLGEYPLVIDPSTVQEKRSDSGRAGALALAGAAVLLVAVLVGWQLDRQKSDKERRGRADRLSREIERDRKMLTRVQGDRDRLREQFKLVSGGPSIGGGPAALEALRTVAGRAPEGVWLTQVSYERDRPLELQGTARDAGRATRFLEALEGTPGFRRVELSYLRSDTQENRPVTRFRIECWRGEEQARLAAVEGGQ